MEVRSLGTKTMREMKTIVQLSCALICSIFVMQGCSEKEVLPQTGTFEFKITATKDASSSFYNPYTKALERSDAENGETIKGTWKIGETISVYYFRTTSEINASDDKVPIKKVGTLTATGSGTTTTFVGTLTGTFYVGQNLMLAYKQGADEMVYDYTGQDGTLEKISDSYDYADSGLTIREIKDGTIIGEGSYFHPYQSIVKFVLKDSEGSPLKASSLTITDPDGNGVCMNKFEPMKARLDLPTGHNPYEDCVTVAPLVISPATPTDEIYAALVGHFFGPLMDADLKLEATVGSDKYVYVKENTRFLDGCNYVVTVNMTKE